MRLPTKFKTAIYSSYIYYIKLKTTIYNSNFYIYVYMYVYIYIYIYTYQMQVILQLTPQATDQ